MNKEKLASQLLKMAKEIISGDDLGLGTPDGTDECSSGEGSTFIENEVRARGRKYLRRGPQNGIGPLGDTDECSFKKLAASFTPEEASEVALKYCKKMKRFYNLGRIYDSIASDPSASFDGFGGQFAVWFEQDGNEVVSWTHVTGNGNTDVEDEFDRYFDGMVFRNKRDLEKILNKFFDAVDDLHVDESGF